MTNGIEEARAEGHAAGVEFLKRECALAFWEDCVRSMAERGPSFHRSWTDEERVAGLAYVRRYVKPNWNAFRRRSSSATLCDPR
jgi:hypothetical protein